MPLTEEQMEMTESQTADDVVAFLRDNSKNDDGQQLFYSWEEIATDAELNQHSVRQAMVGLVRSGLVTSRRRGRRIYYTVTGNEKPIPEDQQEKPRTRAKPKAKKADKTDA